MFSKIIRSSSWSCFTIDVCLSLTVFVLKRSSSAKSVCSRLYALLKIFNLIWVPEGDFVTSPTSIFVPVTSLSVPHTPYAILLHPLLNCLVLSEQYVLHLLLVVRVLLEDPRQWFAVQRFPPVVMILAFHIELQEILSRPPPSHEVYK